MKKLFFILLVFTMSTVFGQTGINTTLHFEKFALIYSDDLSISSFEKNRKETFIDLVNPTDKLNQHQFNFNENAKGCGVCVGLGTTLIVGGIIYGLLYSIMWNATMYDRQTGKHKATDLIGGLLPAAALVVSGVFLIRHHSKVKEKNNLKELEQ